VQRFGSPAGQSPPPVPAPARPLAGLAVRCAVFSRRELILQPLAVAPDLRVEQVAPGVFWPFETVAVDHGKRARALALYS
jgi:hypothetical protein